MSEKAPRKAKIDPVHVQEAAALKRLYTERVNMSQAAFGELYEIGTQGMVWQYLNAGAPLNVKVAAKFARALGVDMAEFSPRLSREMATIAGIPLSSLRVPEGSPIEEVSSAQAKSKWPFSTISQQEYLSLATRDKRLVENFIHAMLADSKKGASRAPGRADPSQSLRATEYLDNLSQSKKNPKLEPRRRKARVSRAFVDAREETTKEMDEYVGRIEAEEAAKTVKKQRA